MINTEKLIKAYKAQSWDLDHCKCDTKTTKPTGEIITALVRLGEYQAKGIVVKPTPFVLADIKGWQCECYWWVNTHDKYCSQCGKRLDWSDIK